MVPDSMKDLQGNTGQRFAYAKNDCQLIKHGLGKATQCGGAASRLSSPRWAAPLALGTLSSPLCTLLPPLPPARSAPGPPQSGVNSPAPLSGVAGLVVADVPGEPAAGPLVPAAVATSS